MKNWLKAMYANIKEYVAGTQGLKLNDDVRRVFDRMLATERAIAADTTVQDALGAEDKFALAAGEILPIEELDRLDRMRQQVEADVQSAMDKRALNKRKARWRARYEAAKESLQADPFWQMVDGIKRRKIERPLHGGMAETEIVGGLNRDSVRELLGAAQYKDFAAVRDDLLRSDGIPVDQAAMGFGYEDADAFIVMLYDRLVAQRETLDKQARALADKGLADEDAQIDPDEGLLAGDSYGDYLQAVEDALLRKMQKAGFRTRKQHVAALKIKGQQAALSDLRSALEKDEYRRQARAQLQGMRLRDIQPQRFSAALRGALTRRNKGLLSKDEYAALKAVQDARMAYALAAEARVIRQDVDKALALVKRVAKYKQGHIAPAQQEALHQLAASYTLGALHGSNDAVLEMMPLANIVEQVTEDAGLLDVAPTFEDWAMKLQNPDTGESLPVVGAMDYRLMTPAQFDAVMDLFSFLTHSGREMSAANKESLRMQVKGLAETSAESMAGLDDFAHWGERGTALGNVDNVLDKLSADTDALLWQMRRADGFQNIRGETAEAGAMEQQIYDPIIEGENQKRARITALNTALAPHLTALMETCKRIEKAHGKALTLKDRQGNALMLPEAIRKRKSKKTWDVDMVMALAFNMGNGGNIERVRNGYSDLNYETVAALLGDGMAMRLFGLETPPVQASLPTAWQDGLLTAEDWMNVQGVWDTLATLWTDTQTAHEKIYGFKPKGIEVERFSVRIGDSVLSMNGGYYPIAYDRELNTSVAQMGSKDDILDRSEGMGFAPSAKSGFTKGRAKSTGKPVRLDTSPLMEHLDTATTFIYLGNAVRFADRVTQNPDFAASYVDKFGMRAFEAIRPNLKGIVRKDPPNNTSVAMIAETMRKYLVPWGLAFNFKVALLQLTALSVGMGDVGAAPVLRGMGAISTRGMGLVRGIWAASPYMESRTKSWRCYRGGFGMITRIRPIR